MLFLFITRARKKAVSALKTMLALAIMVILMIQLLGVIQEATGHYRRWMNRENPHGNPLKVFRGVEEPAPEGGDPLLKKIKMHYQAPGPARELSGGKREKPNNEE